MTFQTELFPAEALGTAPSLHELATLTPVEEHGGIFFKRDDLFRIAGVCGGKVRTCYALAQGACGLVTAGSRASPQINIVAQIARALGVPCRAHSPEGALSPELLAAQSAGAEIIQHRAGYNSVIIARAKADAQAQGYTYIPFGMECWEAVKQTARQTSNIPVNAKRLVMPVGSGMSLAGVLHGLNDDGRTLPVVGVVVGAQPVKRLERYAPGNWQRMVELVLSGTDYHAPAADTVLGGVRLDSRYEAKCIPFIQPGDCLWCVGIRQTEAA
jgi:1-aminocyclopropane-1-carboxylate deaminase/D-cysteine desulfhydrase-like pyridoxal-dependent ACC family enzyme